MELSRSEYPSIVASVPPLPAVKLMRDRLQKGQALNGEIADWLQERRRAEESYANALAKLAKRPVPGDGSELGVFTGPWSRIVESTASMATAHHQFAQQLENDVERPIRDFAQRNTEWSGMKTMETNLGAVAKAIDSAEDRAEKLRKRGLRAKAQHVAEAASAVSNALAEWDSQAPYVFEKLQAADESRCNGLRDALTRFQTLELDYAQSAMQAADATLPLILDANTIDEIKAFTNKATMGRQKIERQPTSSRNHAANPSTPSVVTDDSVSVHTAGSGERGSGERGAGSMLASHGPSLGLKRLSTVLRSRNRNSMFHRSSSPDKRSRGFPAPLSPPQSRSESFVQEAKNLGLPSPTSQDALMPQSNGDHERPPPLAVPSDGPGPAVSQEPRMDSEGYSIPPPVHDLGASSSALADDNTEEHQPQFKVEIKNDVIHEEEEEADAALSKVANTLRAQHTVSRKTRGRRDARDVRNTMFIPSPPDLNPSPIKPLTPELTGSPPLTPMKITPRPGTALTEEGSDTHSIKSSGSITSLAAAAIKHPDLAQPGLSSSIVESVSTSFEGGVPVKNFIAGEIALAFSPQGGETPPTTTIRMDNFAVLEKVAPNPAFITAVPDRAGEYTVSTSSIHKTAVAFKYQVHIDESSTLGYSPIIISPKWKLEPHQASVIVNWEPNPVYRRLNDCKKPFTLRNVIFVVGVEGAQSSSCQSKPVGTFSKERGRLAWRMGDLIIDPENTENAGGTVLARFTTDGMAKATPVESRWEITGEDAETVGSGLTLSCPGSGGEEDESDPFADTSGEDRYTPENQGTWNTVSAVRKIASGRYISS